MKPTIYIKMKPYLKEFILGLEGRDGEKLYGPEPVRFPKKDMLYHLVERLRRKPWPDSIIKKPESKEDRVNYLEVAVEPNPLVKHDDLRIYLSTDSQVIIAKHIYDMFCAVAFEYVNDDLNFQQRMFPRDKPKKFIAYRNFCNDYGITYAEEDSIRKAFDRRTRMLDKDLVKKK